MTLKNIDVGNVLLSSAAQDDLAYVDKTMFIEYLEKRSRTRVPVFLRPRRFGKTFLAWTLFYYYDQSCAEEFDKNFKGTWIYGHKTGLASSYRCLLLDFAMVDSRLDMVESSLGSRLASGIISFAKRYPKFSFSAQEMRELEKLPPEKIMASFLNMYLERCDDAVPIYVIIDEYDHFANEILASNKNAFKRLTSTEKGNEGLIKRFYACLKTYFGPNKIAPIGRFFITGVSAVSLDSLTSGFNIATNISSNAGCSAMAGFTSQELSRLIDETVDFSSLEEGLTKEGIMVVMKRLYDGYVFSPQSGEHVFNSNMCLFFLSRLLEERKIPSTLVDGSMGIDTENLNGIFALCDEKEVREITDSILRNEGIVSKPPKALNLNQTDFLDTQQMISLLSYMGYLTYDPALSAANLSDTYHCPNEIFYEMFVDYASRKMGLNTRPGAVLEEMIRNNNPLPLFKAVSENLKALPPSGAKWFNEIAIQLCCFTTIKDASTEYLKPFMEYDTKDRGRVGLLVENNYAGGHTFVFEFKYLPRSKSSELAVKAKLEEAKQQLARYCLSPNLKGMRKLDCWAAVYSGPELAACEKL